MAFKLPIKGDIDRTLSNLMHDARHRLMAEIPRVMGQAAQFGSLQGNRVIVTIASIADQLHEAAMKEATPILLQFIERMQLPPAEITEWARPQLENLGDSLLGLIPPNNLPADHQRTVVQYRAVFQQRLDGVLRDVEIGFKKNGFAGMATLDEWIRAAEAVQLLKPVLKGTYSAQMRICARAHAGLIRARADRFMMDERAEGNFDIPKEFWWAEGNAALKQDWEAGDFSTWLKQTHHLRAFGVSFFRADIEKMILARAVTAPASAVPIEPMPAKGGRPPADWWEDLLIDVCFRIFRGDLKPKTQADIERAMQEWITERGCEAADSTVRIRARKVWTAIKREAAEN